MQILCPCPHLFNQRALKFLSKKTNLIAKKMKIQEYEKEAIKYDAILIRFTYPVSKRIIGNHSKIKSIICPTTGLDHIDLSLTKKYKIKIYSLKNKKNFLKKITATAELTIALIFLVSRRLIYACNSAINYDWDQSKFTGIELKEKTIGIIGYGRLGKIVSKICHSMSMSVIFYDTNIKIKSSRYAKRTTFKKLLKKSDIISLHIPLIEKNLNIISHNEFKLMKKNTILINTSRGDIINQQALLKALLKNTIFGAGIDVLNQENIISMKNNKLINYAKKNKNLTITPHIGGATTESISKTDHFVITNFLNNNNINK